MTGSAICYHNILRVTNITSYSNSFVDIDRRSDSVCAVSDVDRAAGNGINTILDIVEGIITPGMAIILATLGVIIMGWNTQSIMYIFLWVYFVLYVILTHFALLSEEKINIEKFGQEYADYMKRVPRYFPIK